MLPALLLATLASAAIAFPVQIRHQTRVNLVGAAYLALIIVVPVGAAGAIAYACAIAGRLSPKRTELGEILFNAGQTACYVTAAAVAFDGAHGGAVPGPEITRVGPVAAVVVTVLVLYAVNFTLVSIAVALQARASPWRVWRVNVGRDGLTETATYSIGTVAALLALTYPWSLPILALPVFMLYRSLQQASQVQSDAHEALAHLVGLLEVRDAYTAGHSERVGIIARLLAIRLGLTADEADVIARAGRVHDIGKLVIDPAIIQKAGALSPDEQAKMRRHPQFGAAVVGKFAAFGSEHGVVRSHHERWDGTGYPDGLAGEAIPLGSRIVAVADAYDALNSHRTYQVAKEPRTIERIFRDGAGSQWDPRVVEALMALLADHHVQIPAQPASPLPAARN